ncbi:hypothetical protein [Williamsia sterculiae]|uniref:Uncharacterized protein n=1 Tax=Williamsia sterculiae TaxID=1344003 RepID=A0A1N7HCL7_9NOCA|nr:hypothetical protein [Williamsia sterculiae]SIS22428.1 hypothetical protein SAMN05445060_3947 [Williamsia sterculiae]
MNGGFGTPGDGCWSTLICGDADREALRSATGAGWVLGCRLQGGHSGRHHSDAEAIARFDRHRWLSWDDAGAATALEAKDPCPGSGPDASRCALFAGHPGAHFLVAVTASTGLRSADRTKPSAHGPASSEFAALPRTPQVRTPGGPTPAPPAPTGAPGNGTGPYRLSSPRTTIAETLPDGLGAVGNRTNGTRSHGMVETVAADGPHRHGRAEESGDEVTSVAEVAAALEAVAGTVSSLAAALRRLTT